jgi:hypothetical protein
MKLQDLKNTFGRGFLAGAWIAPTGEILRVNTTHIQDIISNPEKFGTTSQFINDIHKEYGEKVGQEGEARELIIVNALKRGWIRIRAYRNHWSFTVWQLNNLTKNNIQVGVRSFVKSGVMDKYADIKINVVSTDDLKSYEANDIIAGHLNESENAMSNRIARIVEMAALPNMEVDLVESGLARLHAKMARNDIGIISAFRNERNFDENMRLHRQLRAKLIKLGYDVTEVAGTYIEGYDKNNASEIEDVLRRRKERKANPSLEVTDKETQFKDMAEVSERSLFVARKPNDTKNNLERDLVELGKMYGQDSVLIKPVGEPAYLIGTREGASWPEYGTKVDIGMPKMGKTGEFMSRIRGRPMVFESIEEIQAPGTWAGKMALSKIAEGKA